MGYIAEAHFREAAGCCDVWHRHFEDGDVQNDKGGLRSDASDELAYIRAAMDVLVRLLSLSGLSLRSSIKLTDTPRMGASSLVHLDRHG